jgi:hypothetical protein
MVKLTIKLDLRRKVMVMINLHALKVLRETLSRDFQGFQRERISRLALTVPQNNAHVLGIGWRTLPFLFTYLHLACILKTTRF